MHGSDILPTISQLPPTDSTEQPRTAAVEAHPERPIAPGRCTRRPCGTTSPRWSTGST